MSGPSVDELLEGIVAALEEGVLPHVQDEHAASTARTAVQLLRSARVRLRAEPAALLEDNADLRAVLLDVGGRRDVQLSEEVLARLASAAAHRAPPGPPATEDLLAERSVLAAALTAVIDDVPNQASPVRVEARAFLTRSLARRRPWLVDAFTGPRR